MPKKRLIRPSEWVALSIVQIYFAFLLWVFGSKVFIRGVIGVAAIDLVAGVLLYLVVRRRSSEPENTARQRKLKDIFYALVVPLGSLAFMVFIGFSGDARSSLLIDASLSGNDAAVRLLIFSGADINHLDIATPLTAASKANHPTTVEILLEHGAKVDLPGVDGKT